MINYFSDQLIIISIVYQLDSSEVYPKFSFAKTIRNDEISKIFVPRDSKKVSEKESFCITNHNFKKNAFYLKKFSERAHVGLR